MNDRAVGVLEKYDIEVLRSWKGRGAILCETGTGINILKEYKGSEKRLHLQQELLQAIRENGYLFAEELLPAREGELLVKDEDSVGYILKTYREGRECGGRESKDCERSMEQLARLHRAASLPELAAEHGITPFSLEKEFNKHNRELRKVYRYLKEKSRKTDFERMLSRHYNFFYEKAVKVFKESEKAGTESAGWVFCHGDFQHHNILFSREGVFIMNFEKYVWDSPSRDISLFLRKILEKNNWSESLGERLLAAYERQKALSRGEKKDLYYRLSYPEKFWKIVNFYYNSSKTWIPGKNLEKLERLLAQEEIKSRFLNQKFREWVLR